jgi:hypothetical protein
MLAALDRASHEVREKSVRSATYHQLASFAQLAPTPRSLLRFATE